MGSMQDMGVRLKAAGARSLVAGRAMVWLAGIMLLTASSARAEDLSAFAFDQQPGALVPLDQPLQAEDGRTVTLRQVGQGRRCCWCWAISTVNAPGAPPNAHSTQSRQCVASSR